MPGERLSMRKIHEVLRLRLGQGLSQRAVADSLGLSLGAVHRDLTGHAKLPDHILRQANYKKSNLNY
jgi:DNA-directed RNA polymerase specialized sigma24 family protein